MYWERGAILLDGAPAGLGRPEGGDRVLMSNLILVDGTRDRRCLNTDDPDIAAARMRMICKDLLARGRLRTESKAAKLYAHTPAEAESPARPPAHHGAPAVNAVISWEAKLREAARIASLGLAGRATDLAVTLLVYLNHEHGVAFPHVEELAELLKASPETVGRGSRELDRAGAVRFAKRTGAAVRWFPALLDMSPGEAKAKVRALQEAWRSRRNVDPSKMTDQLGPSNTTPRDPSYRGSKMTDLNPPRNNPRVIVGDRAITTEAAFKLAEEVAQIAGLRAGEWPRSWQSAPKIAQQWLSERGWMAEVCLQAARTVMATKQGGPPISIKYFERAIERLWNSVPSAVTSEAGGR